MRIEKGNIIQYHSAAGHLTAEVKGIVLDLNAAGETIPWLVLAELKKYAGVIVERSQFRLCATDNYLKMMKVEVL